MSRTTKITVGEIEVTSLTDGETVFGSEMFPNADEAEIATLLAQDGKEGIETNFNAFLMKTGSHTVLVDAGPRDLFGETCGFLPDALAEAETKPEDITDLFFTHLHPDHIAGAITPEGEAVFPNAQIYLSEAEHSFWSDAGQFSDETQQQWQQLAMAVLNAYEGRFELVKGEATIAPGVTALPLPGHTPGHCGFRVDDGTHSFAQLGDVVHAQSLQIANPEISVVFDVDADMARKARKQALDMAATDGMLISGGHILRPTIARLERSGAGYRLVSE
ncbi:MAG: MBL fold metallo-hydrolase [Rhodobacteraceae bacterium]|nr:MBL fold metallo-hydrolase [Paracoccaceae bacterium]